MRAIQNSAVTIYNDFFPQGTNRRYLLNTSAPYAAISLSVAVVNAVVLKLFVSPVLDEAIALQDSPNVRDRFLALTIQEQAIANGTLLTCCALLFGAIFNFMFFLDRNRNYRI